MRASWIPVTLVVLVVSGLLVYSLIGVRTPDTAPITAQPPVIISGIESVPYLDSLFGFSLWRPATAEVISDNFDGYLPVTGRPEVAFVLTGDFATDTNLIDAGVYIGVSAEARAIRSCDSPGENETAKGAIIIADTRFATFERVGAAAGNIYESKSYRAVHNGSCFEIVEMVHSGQIGNYPSGKVRQFDAAGVSDALEALSRTFTFTDDAKSGVEGTVLLGQACPIQRANDPECDAKPFRTRVGVYSDTQEVMDGETDASGRFRLALEPGSYELRAFASSTRHCISVGVVVPSHTFIAADISCDSGPR